MLTMGRTHATIKSLARMFIDEAVPNYNKRLGLLYSLEISPQERFRITRAFYRYRSFVNLYCTGEVFRELGDEHGHLFFTMFSPWVNELIN